MVLHFFSGYDDNLLFLLRIDDHFKLIAPTITITENQDVLDLIWKKGYGILNILDDQCRAPGTTDKTFANDLYQKLTGKPRFEANFRQVGARQFGVFHYAGMCIFKCYLFYAFCIQSIFI